MDRVRTVRDLLVPLVQGKKRKDTVCIVLGDDTCEEPKIRMNKVCAVYVRFTLCTHVSDGVRVRPFR